MEKEKIIEKLKDTSLYSEFQKITEIYQELSLKQQTFCDTFDIHCKKGCGTCCEHFIPDVSTAEARYLALGLILEGKEEEAREKIASWDRASGYCPLYDFHNEYHCTVYQYRPLICRLFGATASKNKEGRPCFRKCKYNEIGHDVEPTELEKNKSSVIHMSDYAMMMEEFSLDEKERLLLPDSLIREMNKIMYILELIDE